LSVPASVFKLTGLSVAEGLRLHREITSLRDALDRREPSVGESELCLAKVE
jgi:hypothetical protein